MDIPETGEMRVLYNQHGAALWRYACRLTSNAIRAEGVVQETLLRACQRQEAVDGNERSTRAWLFAVARDLSSDGAGASTAAESDELNSALDRTLVADALARLSAEHRAVVRRAYFCGWSIAQISADLRIDDATAKSRLHYALRALRQSLQEMGMEQ
jgi:RNA polymerase sigma-70 factor (ECF subfamily)